MNGRLEIVALAALLSVVPAAHADDGDWLNVKAQATPTAGDGGPGAYVVGVPFRVDLVARHGKGGIALVPEKLSLPDTLAERDGARRRLRSSEPGEEIDRYELELIAFEPGELTIPPIRLAFGSTMAESAPIQITVVSGLSDDDQRVASSTLAEAIDELEKSAAQNPSPQTVPIADYRLLWAAGAIFALAILALGLRAWLKRRAQSVGAAPPPPPPRPADELAIERLTALAKQDRQGPRLQKAFWVELSEILRAYAGGRYGFDSIELTVAELFQALEGRETPGLDRTLLRRLLDTADLAKFAKLVTADQECAEALARGRELVETTRPRPPPEDVDRAGRPEATP